MKRILKSIYSIVRNSFFNIVNKEFLIFVLPRPERSVLAVVGPERHL